ncbi:MAG: recombination protein O N-terminal domain-containing protein [Parcubacteria group bacterium]|nr:recombination protein O N-terminal domain-containing protein [Parcubacteria group bacterium]
MFFAQGIILEKKERGDADWRYVALTHELGKIEFISRGGRKGMARLSGHIEPLTCANLEFATTHSLKLIGASGVHHYYEIKHTPALFSHVSDVVHFFGRLLPLEYRDHDLFVLLSSYLEEMDVLGRKKDMGEMILQEHTLFHSFKFLNTCADILGVSPQLQLKHNEVQLGDIGALELLKLNTYLRNHLTSQL